MDHRVKFVQENFQYVPINENERGTKNTCFIHSDCVSPFVCVKLQWFLYNTIMMEKNRTQIPDIIILSNHICDPSVGKYRCPRRK